MFKSKYKQDKQADEIATWFKVIAVVVIWLVLFYIIWNSLVNVNL